MWCGTTDSTNPIFCSSGARTLPLNENRRSSVYDDLDLRRFVDTTLEIVYSSYVYCVVSTSRLKTGYNSAGTGRDCLGNNEVSVKVSFPGI